MRKDNYQLCTRCVMDNASDDTITFDSNGVCSYCSNALEYMKVVYFPNSEGEKKLKELIEKLKSEGKDKEYDCIMGISGGLDSSYLLYLGHEWGLRILAVHVDDGFDTEVSKRNLNRLKEIPNVDFRIDTPNSEQFNALSKAYILAGVPNIAVPQDNVIFAYLYHYARKYKVRHFLSGGNFALESILQNGNTYRVFDLTNIKAIHRKFGTKPIKYLKLLSDYQRFYDQKILKLETHRPLNLIDYNRDKALKELVDFCGFEYYGSKHLENTLTKFVQNYWFYNKFNVDKRRSHLSSMIISNQMNRSDALLELEKPLYDESTMQKEIKLIQEILDISDSELQSAINQPNKQHEDYPTDWFYPIFKKIFY